MSQDDVLVAITASREKGEIVYRVECSSNLTNEEFEYYLGEIIKGICKWKKTSARKTSEALKEPSKKRKNKRTIRFGKITKSLTEEVNDARCNFSTNAL